VLIVELKAERERQYPVDGENGRKGLALRKWAKLNPDRLKYEMIFTAATGPTGRRSPWAKETDE
jgi:type III restriction enzyme